MGTAAMGTAAMGTAAMGTAVVGTAVVGTDNVSEIVKVVIEAADIVEDSTSVEEGVSTFFKAAMSTLT